MHATIARVNITGPHHAPFVILEGRNIPATGPAPVLLKWKAIKATVNYAAQLVDSGNAFA